MSKENFNYRRIVSRIQDAVGATTIDKLAEKLGRSKPTIHSWQKGKGLDLIKLEEIAQKYKINLKWLLFEDGTTCFQVY